MPIVYRAFAHGGNPTFAVNGYYGMPTEIDYRYRHSNAGIAGTLFKDAVDYDAGVTIDHWTECGNWPDVIGYRLQEAMNGFGGPDCNVST